MTPADLARITQRNIRTVQEAEALIDRLFRSYSAILSIDPDDIRDDDEFLRRLRVELENPIMSIPGLERVIEKASGIISQYPASMGEMRSLYHVILETGIRTYLSKANAEFLAEFRTFISRRVAEKTPYTEIMKELHDRYSELPRYRVKRVVRTEMMRANNLLNYYAGIKEFGHDAYYRVTTHPDPCPICRERYKFGEVIFPASDTANIPPLHPNCRCTISWLPLSEIPGDLRRQSRQPISRGG